MSRKEEDVFDVEKIRISGFFEMVTQLKALEKLTDKLEKEKESLSSKIEILEERGKEGKKEKNKKRAEEIKVKAFHMKKSLKELVERTETILKLQKEFLDEMSKAKKEKMKEQEDIKNFAKLSKEKRKAVISNIESIGDKLCLICCVNDKETFVYPCGHLVVCEKCSDELGKKRNFEKKCIFCKSKILRVYYLKSGKIIDFTEKKKEDNDGKCVLCQKNERETVVDPCGHLVLCEECSDKLPRTKFKAVCIECGQKIVRISYIKRGKEIFL